MKTAQLQNYKKIALSTGIVAITTIFITLKSGVLAQGASNPFVPNPDSTTGATQIQPVISGPTNSNNTIAQDQIALTAIPPRIGDDGSLKAAPGEKLQIQLRVRNISEKSVSVVTSVQDFLLDQDGETPIPIDDNVSNRWSLASWLTISPTEHIIGSKSTVGISVLIEIPEDALPGGHYAMVLHEPGGSVNNNLVIEDINNGSNTAINQRVGTLLYVIVEGPINEEAYVRDFRFPQFSEYGPVPFEFTVENNSDLHITPQMSVEIFNLLNQKIETIAIDQKNIFPLSSRKFANSWDRIWGWGLYKAKLTMSYGSMGSIVVANSSFWLLPIKLIIAGLTILLTFLLSGLAIRKHLKHKQVLEEKRIAELESQIEELQSNGK